MATLYGSQGGTIATNAFIWAARAQMNIVGPKWGESGIVYHVAIPWSSLSNSSGDVSFSVNSLKRFNPTVSNKIDTYSVTSAVVNNDILSEVGKIFNPTTNPIQMEMCHFLIYESPMTNLMTGSASTYTMEMTTFANFCFFPLTTDSFVAAIEDPAIRSKLENLSDGGYGPTHRYNPKI